MRILIFTQYFTPEIGATQTRLHAFASGLAARGHEVEVVCGVPNHPQGVIHEGYRGRLRHRRELDGFAATYVWVHTRPKKSTRARLAFYGTYAALATAAGAVMPRADVILASSPPLPVATAGMAVARLRRVPWVMDVRDLWPAAAVAMGELGPGRVLRAAERLERQLYRSADAVTVVTRPFANRVAAITAREEIHLVPNGTTELWLAARDLEPEREELGLPASEFIWTFAGNVGGAQGLESAIEAAELLGPGFRLLVLGDGPARRRLEDLARNRARAVVDFRDQVPPEEARRYLRSSDALLVSLASDPILEDFVPSKLFDFCATGIPVICAAAGEPARLAADAGAALIAAPEDSESLRVAIRRLHDSDSLRADLSTGGQAFAAKNLRSSTITALETVLSDVSHRAGSA